MALAQSDAIQVLVDALHAWAQDEFQGSPFPDIRANGRVRFHQAGDPAKIGWDIKQNFIHVWINQPRKRSADDLRSQLSDPSSVHENQGHVSFRVHTRSDIEALKAVIRRHVHATATSAGE